MQICSYKRMMVLVSAGLCLGAGCKAVDPASLIRDSEMSVAANQAEVTLPFRLAKHAILVEIRLGNAPRPYLFMVDTGAITTIDPRVKQELGLATALSTELGDSTGKSQEVEMVRLPSMQLGSFQIDRCGATVVDLGVMEQQFVGVRVDGLLGSNALRHFAVTLDYQNKVLRLAKTRPANVPPGSIGLPFSLRLQNGLAPELMVNINGNLPTPAIIDTGTDLTLIPHQYMSALGILPHRPHTVTGYGPAGGVFSPNCQVVRGRVNTILLNGLAYHQALVTDSGMPVVALGRKFLAHYLTTLDYPNRQMVLTPVAGDQGLDAELTAGLALRREPSGQVVVAGLLENLPAHRAGLQMGDKIEAINGKPVSDYSTADIFDLVADDRVTQLNLRISRDGTARSVVLKKESLLPLTGKNSVLER